MVKTARTEICGQMIYETMSNAINGKIAKAYIPPVQIHFRHSHLFIDFLYRIIPVLPLLAIVRSHSIPVVRVFPTRAIRRRTPVEHQMSIYSRFEQYQVNEQQDEGMFDEWICELLTLVL